MTLRSFAQPFITAARKTRNRLFNLIDPPVVVLIYHRVATLESDPQQLAVTPDNFRAQMQYLKENVQVVRFEDDWSKVKQQAVAITFDDGYADNSLEALPVLEEVGVPATFFVSTGSIGTRQEFWWDELERLILGDRAFPARFVLNDSRFGRAWATGAVAERQVLYREIQPLIRKLDAPGREEWLTQLREWAQAGNECREAWRAMALDELRRLAESRWVTIGAHTVTHTPLSSQPVAAQQEEITESRRQLESWLGRKITVFSYPFGARGDYTQETVRLCREAGFVRAAANFPGQAHRWTDPFQVPRQLVRNWPAALFSEKLRGYWTL
jgi:peptidoglycan/xylan/chitin deacetylase (PgdA/CDA1 family)